MSCTIRVCGQQYVSVVCTCGDCEGGRPCRLPRPAQVSAPSPALISSYQPASPIPLPSTSPLPPRPSPGYEGGGSWRCGGGDTQGCNDPPRGSRSSSATLEPREEVVWRGGAGRGCGSLPAAWPLHDTHRALWSPPQDTTPG